MIHVGIWLSEKKWKEMGQLILDHLNSNITNGMRIIAKRIRNKHDILIQYDLIVHKINDLFYQTKENSNSLTIHDLRWYMKEYPETIILDSIYHLHLLLDRHLLYNTLSNSLLFPPSIKLPKHALLQTTDDIASLNIPFPISNFAYNTNF